MPNAALAYKVLDHIIAHPEEHKPEMWIGNECGTVACFAGWTVIFSGDIPVYEDGINYTDEVRTSIGDLEWIPARAAKLLGMPRDGGHLAANGYRLFNMNNTLDDIERLVDEIFGPRPEAGE